jgi:hypothetical protein
VEQAVLGRRVRGQLLGIRHVRSMMMYEHTGNNIFPFSLTLATRYRYVALK